ncbi:hypothetical protein [Streptomyces angustmyceticus]|uniref:hypothetical protein n=1 Tax=Streptomyces angustmyceticus TaxID=285578 RepID=UPI003D8D3876
MSTRRQKVTGTAGGAWRVRPADCVAEAVAEPASDASGPYRPRALAHGREPVPGQQ